MGALQSIYIRQPDAVVSAVSVEQLDRAFVYASAHLWQN